MSWGRNDDNMLEHLKWKMLEDDARLWADALALWSAARDYANRASTDGYIPEVCLRSLTPMDRRRAKVVAEALVSARPPGYTHGLWEPAQGGYQIHDFLVYNESRASKAAKAEQERANAEAAEASRNAERTADAARKRAKRAEEKSGACPPDSPPDTSRTEAGQSGGQDTGHEPDSPADVSRPRAHARTPAHAHARASARGPGPARPDPDRSPEDLEGDPAASVSELAPDPALARLRHEFERRWLAKRTPNGMALGTTWVGFGKHYALAADVAHRYADRPDELERSLDGFFASTERFVADTRWSFKTWANNPERYVATRAEPSSNAIERIRDVPRMETR